MNKLLQNKIESAKARRKHETHTRWCDPERYLFTLNPIFQTALWMLALIWGTSASLLSDRIMDFVLPSFDTGLTPNWYTVLFLGTGCLLALGFAISQWVGRAQDSMVVDSMITMPPHDFWLYYGAEYTNTSALVENSTLALLDELPFEQDREALENGFHEDVRRVLNSIVNLVKKWDSSNIRGNRVVYRANIMSVYRFEDKDAEDFLEPMAELAERFSLKPVKSHYSGFVGLADNAFTTTTQTEAPTKDTDCKPIAFPFTEREHQLEQPIHANILGSPVAVAECASSYVADVNDIIEHYKTHASNLDQRILDNLVAYYADTSLAHSILSIPIYPVQEQRPRWVVNVYRNQGGLLFDGEKVVDFAEIIKPFSDSLARMMYAWELYYRPKNAL